MSYQAAVGALDLARAFLNTVVTGAGRWALDVAREALHAAQQVADGVLSGTHFITRQTALAALELARRVADAVLTGTEAVALNTAEEFLKGMNVAAEEVLSGFHFLAWESSKAGLKIAEKTLKGVEAATTATLDGISTALQSVGRALQQVRTAGFLQLNSLGFRILARTSRAGVTASYDFSIAGRRIAGQMSVQLNNPRDMILGLIQGEAIKAIKASFGAMAPYLP